MTVIVAVDILSEMIVVADTRVSWPDRSHAPQDIVQKLYRIRSPRTPGKEAVIGYSGDLSAIRAVALYLGGEKFRHYSRPLVMSTLKDDLAKWIEEATTKLETRQRAGLKFMLCGIEPSRAVPINRGTKSVTSPRMLETHMYVFDIHPGSGRVAVTRERGFATIGSGADRRAELRRKILPAIHFGFHQKNLHWARAVLVGQIANSVIRQSGIESVGGPLQVVRISPGRLTATYTWPDESDDRNTEVSHKGDRVVLRNRSSKKEYTLYPIWALPTEV